MGRRESKKFFVQTDSACVRCKICYIEEWKVIQEEEIWRIKYFAANTGHHKYVQHETREILSALLKKKENVFLQDIQDIIHFGTQDQNPATARKLKISKKGERVNDRCRERKTEKKK